MIGYQNQLQFGGEKWLLNIATGIQALPIWKWPGLGRRPGLKVTWWRSIRSKIGHLLRSCCKRIARWGSLGWAIKPRERWYYQ
jgi:hypothetical protein